MSDRETTQPTPRMQITEASGSAPPWDGLKFVCEKCKGEFQLEAADQCTHTVSDTTTGWKDRFWVPPCPTPGCGHINAVEKINS